MSKRTTMVGVLLAAWCLLPAGPAWADKPVAAGQRDVKKPAAGKFIRITRNARDQPVALETAIARYVPAAGEGGLQVDLIGAVQRVAEFLQAAPLTSAIASIEGGPDGEDTPRLE